MFEMELLKNVANQANLRPRLRIQWIECLFMTDSQVKVLICNRLFPSIVLSLA